MKASAAESPSELSIVNEYPDSWTRLDDLPLLASDRWIRVFGQRIEGTQFWASLESGARVRAGMAGVLVQDPDAYLFGNCARLLFSPASPFVEDRELARRLSTLESQASLQSLFPNVVVTHPGYIAFAVGEDRSDPRVLHRLFDGIVAWAAVQGAALVAVLYVDPREELLSRVLRESGFHRVTFTAEGELAVPRGGFPTYLASLPGRRRQRIRRERKIVSDGHLAARTRPLTDGLVAEMVRLRGLHRAKYGLPADPPTERGRLLRLRDHLPEAATVITVEDGRDNVVSFTLFVRDRTAWHAMYTGTDYEHPAHRGAYFEATYYAAIEIAATLGVTDIYYGIGTEDAKRLRGCRLFPISAWLGSRSASVDRLLTEVADAWSSRGPHSADRDT